MTGITFKLFKLVSTFINQIFSFLVHFQLPWNYWIKFLRVPLDNRFMFYELDFFFTLKALFRALIELVDVTQVQMEDR